jgi:hypothetical protein
MLLSDYGKRISSMLALKKLVTNGAAQTTTTPCSIIHLLRNLITVHKKVFLSLVLLNFISFQSVSYACFLCGDKETSEETWPFTLKVA